jgi:hypothetical protein
MNRFLGVLGLALCTGCTSVVVRPYTGEQQNWPLGGAGFVSTGFGMPIFASLPPQPYDIVAELRIKRPTDSQPGQSELPAMVKKAKRLGADGLVFIDPFKFFGTDYGPRNPSAPPSAPINPFRPESFEPGTTFLAIKWLKAPAPTNAPARP